MPYLYTVQENHHVLETAHKSILSKTKVSMLQNIQFLVLENLRLGLMKCYRDGFHGNGWKFFQKRFSYVSIYLKGQHDPKVAYWTCEPMVLSGVFV